MQHWQSLFLSGLQLEWLDCVHGFAPKPSVAVDLSRLVTITSAKAFSEASHIDIALETDFMRAELSSQHAARLHLKKEIPIGDPKGLMPLTAALAQQWLLANSLSMHAAVFEFVGKTLMVLGNSHAGKSTLVRSALQLGARVVTDDLARITFDAELALAQSLRGFVRFRANADSPEAMHWIRLSDPRFAAQLAIDAILCLDSIPRQSKTVIRPISTLEATAQLINQCAPLFLRREFPAERAIMMALMQRLLANRPVLRVTTGFDVIDAPQQAFSTITAALWPTPVSGFGISQSP